MLLQKNLDRLVSIYIFVVIMFFKKSFDYLVVTDRLFGSIVVEKNLRFRLDFVNIPELSIDSIQNIAEAGVSHWLDHNYRCSQIYCECSVYCNLGTLENLRFRLDFVT